MRWTRQLKLHSVPELQGIDVPAPRNLTALYDADDVIKPRVKMTTLLSAYCSEMTEWQTVVTKHRLIKS